MNIKTLTLGDYATNCHILWQEEDTRCLVIDPGYEPERVLEAVDKLGLRVEAILLTHGHFDHVGGVKAIAADTDCKVFLNTADCAMPPMLTNGTLYYTDSLRDGQHLSLAGLELDVLSTPGHTPGSVCLICQDHIFSGDTLFAMSCGRTDLPGGNSKQMRESLARLSALTGNYFIHPGHGSSTCLRDEKKYNPYLGAGR